MTRDIVVFETKHGVLDFRLIRGALPIGSAPLAIVENGGGFAVSGQENSRDDVVEFSRTQSGYPLTDL